jgi:methionine synthase I (cobalamin-dependent)
MGEDAERHVLRVLPSGLCALTIRAVEGTSTATVNSPNSDRARMTCQTCSLISLGLLRRRGKRKTMTRAEEFLDRLQAGDVLLADGATGTMVHGMDPVTGVPPEVWLFEQPDRILALHQDYVRAGAELILTCSFGGTRYRLAQHGLGDRVVEVNRRAAELARQVAGDEVFVVGDMGPTGQLLVPLGQATADEFADAYAEQAAGLAEGGADLLLVETMSDLGEARAAVEGARRVTDLPIVCTFSFDTHGRTMMGLRPERAAREIGPVVQVVGANCGKDPSEFMGFVQAMRQAMPQAVLWAKPNAGLPRIVDERVVYDATPEYMGQIALQLRQAGAQIVGGCCGTTPAHVAAMAAALGRSV